MPAKLTEIYSDKSREDASPCVTFGPPPFAIDFSKKDGNRFALPYANIDTITWRPGKTLVVVSRQYKVVIRGENLEPVYLGLVQHSVCYLAALRDGSELGDGVPTIRSIIVKEKK